MPVERVPVIPMARCLRKHRYRSDGLAGEAVKRMVRKGLVKGPEMLSIYYCDVCWGWHVGRVREGVAS